MKKKIESLKEFHTLYELGYSNEVIARLAENKHRLRHRLMEEENREYLEAAEADDKVGVADALGDMLYVLCGTIIEHGMHEVIDQVFEEIHRSNLSKLDDKGKVLRRADGKVIKGPNYSPPDLDFVNEL